MTYKNYSDTDFIKDEFFVKWVKNPDKETNLFWMSWIANNPEKRRDVEVARKFLEEFQIGDKYSLPEEEFLQVHENIIRYNQEHKYNTQTSLFEFRNNYTRPLAAAILLLIISAPVLVYISQYWNSGADPIAYVTHSAGTGTKSTLKLPDGTVVKLNANSKIRYPESFDNKREVFLEGEAFFEVVKDTAKPFLVHSQELTTKVLGTSFNVRSYQREHETKIALLEGKVQVESESSPVPSILLNPTEMVVFDKQGERFNKQQFNYLAEFGWKDGILYFSDKTLRQVFIDVEQWYGVDIQVDDEISLNDLYKGEFHNESLENVLTSICYSSDLAFKIQGDNVKVFKTKK